jgi:hypothetical protein
MFDNIKILQGVFLCKILYELSNPHTAMDFYFLHSRWQKFLLQEEGSGIRVKDNCKRETSFPIEN